MARARSLLQRAIDAVEHGWVPDYLTRVAIRRLLKRRLAREDQGSSAANEAAVQRFVAEACRGPLAPVPEKANAQHYEVPADFYHYVLGPRRKYSSCLWDEGVTTLAEAEERALAATCRHAELEDGMDVLELGCGWGSLTLWIAEQYPQARITAVSNSHSQREYIQQLAEAKNVADRVTLITADMNAFQTARQFDRVVSVEMFEHMRNYRELLKRIAGWLRSDGKLLVHIFCHRQLAYEFQEEGAANWMGRYFFSGGIMPSYDYLQRFPDNLQVTRQWRWDGEHYQKTAEAWVANLDRHRDTLLPLLQQIYGGEAYQWWMRWRLLFLAGAELFGYRGGQEWFVTHCLLEHAARPATAAVPSTVGCEDH